MGRFVDVVCMHTSTLHCSSTDQTQDHEQYQSTEASHLNFDSPQIETVRNIREAELGNATRGQQEERLDALHMEGHHACERHSLACLRVVGAVAEEACLGRNELAEQQAVKQEWIGEQERQPTNVGSDLSLPHSPRLEVAGNARQSLGVVWEEPLIILNILLNVLRPC